MILEISGIMLMIFGLIISIIFWVPGVFDRAKIKDMMGERYPLVYVIYIANGPMLIIFGLLLLVWAKFH